MLDGATLRYAERLAAAYQGLDALHRAANPGDAWGLVVLRMEGAPEPQAFATWQDADAAFVRLADAAADLVEPDRRRYYADLCTSARTVVAWNEDPARVPLPDQVRGFLAAPPRPPSAEELASLRADLAAALAAAGYAGDLRSAARTWEADDRVAPEHLATTMTDLMVEANERAAKAFDVPMPALPSVSIVRGAGFNARCDFANGVVELNADPVVTLASLRHLTLHEVVPGHCLQFETRARAHREGWGGADGLLSLVKSAGSPLFEGVADAGDRLIGWTTPRDRIGSAMTRLRAALGTAAAWGLHHQDWTLEEAHAWLLEEAPTGDPGWVVNRLAYIAPRGRGAHVWSYWLGEPAVRDAFEAIDGGPTPAHLRLVYGRMHSLASLPAALAPGAR